VIAASPDKDNDPFQVIKIKPAADIGRLEEVLVITKMADDSQTAASGPTPMRAADILSQRLPSVPKVDPNAPKTPGSAQTGVSAPKHSPMPAQINKAVSQGTEQKAGTGTGQAKPTTIGTGAAVSTPNKTAAEAKKQLSPGQQPSTPANANGAAATTPPKPRPTPKKAVTPAAAPDSTTQQPSAAPTATPRATSTPAANQPSNQERPPR
jgi:rod shape-determining protein MreC